MSTDGVTGRASRLDRWLDEHAAGLLDRKRRLEAVYAETRAERAERRGDLDAAETYYDRARGLRGKLGDREAAIDLGMKQASVARENGDHEGARKQFQRVVELHARRQNAAGALDALEPLLDLLDDHGDEDDRRQWWGHAMTVLGRADPGEIADQRRNALVERYAEEMHTEDSAGRLYGFALQRLLAGDEAGGAALLDATWERRDVVREQVGQFRVVLAAGVARVAHAELADRDESAGRDEPAERNELAGWDEPADREVDREEVLAYVADHRERLSEPASALFERLHEGATDADPGAFRADVDPDDEVELRTLEAEVFGRFLDDLDR